MSDRTITILLVALALVILIEDARVHYSRTLERIVESGAMAAI